jgi:hypothetical protein
MTYQLTVTNMAIARQRFGKQIPEVTQSTVARPPLLGTKSLGTFRSNGQNTDNNNELFEVVFSLRSAPSYKREFIRESSSSMWRRGRTPPP